MLSFVFLHVQAAISIFGIIGGPLLGLFTLGILCPCANSKVSLSYFYLPTVIFQINPPSEKVAL